MSACVTPAEGVTDARYVYGVSCPWHGSVRSAGERSTGEPCCPGCGGELAELPTEHDFWAMIRNQERNVPNYEAMLRWAGRRCFGDFDTLQNAWRQAMEGQS